MSTLKLLFAALAIFSCAAARASYFEYCYLDGQVMAAAKAKKKSSQIEFLVNNSVASTLKNEGSYDPKVCSEYVGKTIKIKFRTKQKTQYTVGEHLIIRQFVIDAMTSDGMAQFIGWEVVNPQVETYLRNQGGRREKPGF